MIRRFKLKEIFIRQLLIFGMSVFFALAFSKGMPDVQLGGERNVWMAVLGNFIFITAIWNINLYVLHFIEMGFTWEKQPATRLVLSALSALIIPTLVQYLYNNYLFIWLNGSSCKLEDREKNLGWVISLAMTLMINAIIISIEFFQHWKKTLTEKEELKRITLTAEFESLKSQVNPHFLFNSLNTLSSLIDEDPATANRFVEHLASVYRYLLSQKDKEHVSLKDELAFIKSYVYLNQIRFGENLVVSISIDPIYEQAQIVTLTLQLLMENAIKHNVISKEKPLLIELGVRENRLFMRNNLQPKRVSTASNGIGLSNIVNRYRYFSKEEVLVESASGKFEVSVPLLFIAE